MRRAQNRRFGQIMLGIVLVIIGLAALSGEPGLAWLLGLGGLYLLFRQFERSQQNIRRGQLDESRRASAQREPHMITDAPSGMQIYAHALEAVRRAGLEPGETPVLPVDLGVMAFSGSASPSLHRTRPVLDNVDYIQPFVQLKLSQRAAGKIRFEIIDSDGQSIFIHEDYHDLQPGMNLLSPPSRLPIHDAQAMHGSWTLRISADDITLAEHRFFWAESTERIIRRHVQVDGELSNEMKQMLEDNRLGRLSLDDLLAEQEAESEPKRARR